MKTSSPWDNYDRDLRRFEQLQREREFNRDVERMQYRLRVLKVALERENMR